MGVLGAFDPDWSLYLEDVPYVAAAVAGGLLNSIILYDLHRLYVCVKNLGGVGHI